MGAASSSEIEKPIVAHKFASINNFSHTSFDDYIKKALTTNQANGFINESKINHDSEDFIYNPDIEVEYIYRPILDHEVKKDIPDNLPKTTNKFVAEQLTTERRSPSPDNEYYFRPIFKNRKDQAIQPNSLNAATKLSNIPLHYNEYPRYSNTSGEIFIYNFESFDENPRRGSHFDVDELVDTFKRLNYNIRDDQIFHDLRKVEVLASIAESIAKLKNSSKSINCIIVFFLSHGKANNTISTLDDDLTVEEIIQAFQCHILKDIPKWFTFLACKTYEEERHKANKGFQLVPKQTFEKSIANNIIIYYSTTEGNLSARIPEKGSWVIQELCKNMNGFGRHEDLFNILTRTNKSIANNYIGKSATNYHQQCPVVVSTLTNKLFLVNSKYRTTQYEILEEVRNISRLFTQQN